MLKSLDNRQRTGKRTPLLYCLERTQYHTSIDDFNNSADKLRDTIYDIDRISRIQENLYYMYVVRDRMKSLHSTYQDRFVTGSYK